MGNKLVILPPNQNKFVGAEYASATDYSTCNIHREQFCLEHKLPTLFYAILQGIVSPKMNTKLHKFCHSVLPHLQADHRYLKFPSLRPILNF